MILYFNCKIISGNLYGYNDDSFYPFMMPKDYYVKNSYQQNIKLLERTILSFQKLNFTSAYLNIDIENKDDQKKIEILIKKHINTKSLFLAFSRPSNIVEWKDNVRRLNLKNDDLILTYFNHDHPFVDYNIELFDGIKKLLKEKINSYANSIFYYSHTPEIISRVIKNNSMISADELFEIEKLKFGIESFAIMTYKTLNHIFNSVVKAPDYFGRTDWPGLYFKDLKIKAFSYPREFFGHLEGYHHVSGYRGYKTYDSLSLPKSGNKNDFQNFYYQRWLNLFFLTIRDNNKFTSKKRFKELIEYTIEIFCSTNIQKDFQFGYLNSDPKEMEFNLRSKIYYNLNSIFNELKTDRILFRSDISFIGILKGHLKKGFLYRLYLKKLKYFN